MHFICQKYAQLLSFTLHLLFQDNNQYLEVCAYHNAPNVVELACCTELLLTKVAISI